MLLDISRQWPLNIYIYILKPKKVDKPLVTSILTGDKTNLMLLDISRQWPLNIYIYILKPKKVDKPLVTSILTGDKTNLMLLDNSFNDQPACFCLSLGKLTCP